MKQYFACFFESTDTRNLFGVILRWHPSGAYSVVGCGNMQDALEQLVKDSALYRSHGWEVTVNSLFL